MPLLAAAFPAAIWGFVWSLAQRSGLRRASRRTAFTLAGILATVQGLVIVANIGAPTWRDARSLSPALLVLPLAAGLGLGVLAVKLGPPDPAGSPVTQTPTTPAVRRGERPVWIGRAMNRGVWGVAAVLAIPALAPFVLDAHNDVPPIIAVGPIAVLTLLLSTVRVVVGPRAVLVGIGPWGWPRRRFPMDQLRSATIDMIEPMDRGGWGYRLGMNGPSLIRRGEALVLNLRNGGQFTVTVDGAREAAGVVNSYVHAG